MLDSVLQIGSSPMHIVKFTTGDIFPNVLSIFEKEWWDSGSVHHLPEEKWTWDFENHYFSLCVAVEAQMTFTGKILSFFCTVRSF